MNRTHRIAAALLVATAAACAGNVYLPNEPGGARSDISGVADREAWLAAHPEADDEVREAIREGVFIEGMTLEHRNVVTNSDRRGARGNGYWRHRDLGDEVRYQWFVSAQREPFDDGRGRAVCELVYVDDVLHEIRYCSGVEDAGT
ncbi:MAG: hypothetical protein ACODAB_06210 [Gemmatimonadota bacterium]